MARVTGVQEVDPDHRAALPDYLGVVAVEIGFVDAGLHAVDIADVYDGGVYGLPPAAGLIPVVNGVGVDAHSLSAVGIVPDQAVLVVRLEVSVAYLGGTDCSASPCKAGIRGESDRTHQHDEANHSEEFIRF
ncbi:hypothetical protein ACFLWV_00310 [Chloroflexota bacterium]